MIEIVLIRAKQRATVPLAHQHRRNILPIIGIKLDVSNRNLAEYELQIVSLTQNRRRVNLRISQSISLDSNCRMLSHSSHTHKYKTAGGRSNTSHKNRYSSWARSAGNYNTRTISPWQQGDSQQPDQIDHLPKRGNLVGATILVIWVVHMLPNIKPEDRNPDLLIHQSSSNQPYRTSNHQGPG